MDSRLDVDAAKRYLAQHNLHFLFESMAAELVQLKPADPLTYLEERISREQLLLRPSYRIVFLVGGPGSGKTTLGSRMVNGGMEGVVVVSLTDVFAQQQAYITNGEEDLICPEAEAAIEMKENGVALSPEILTALLKHFIFQQKPGSIIVLDGYPTDLSQLLHFEREIAPCEFGFFLSAPDDILHDRLVEVSLTDSSGDGASLDQIKESIRYFNRKTLAVAEYLQAKGRLRTVDADGPPEAVYLSLRGYLTTDKGGK